MGLQIKDTELEGVKLIVPERFEDHRGTYLEIFDEDKYKGVCGNLKFIQDDVSISNKDVLRGIHGDFSTTKLVTVLNGSGYAVIVDNREDSSTYNQWQAFLLSRENRNQLFLPAGIGNSILALENNMIYYYKQTTHFVDGRQFTIKWNDPIYNFWWPIKEPILSKRDQAGDYA